MKTANRRRRSRDDNADRVCEPKTQIFVNSIVIIFMYISCLQVVFVSGKHGVTLEAERNKRRVGDVAVVRLERLCPFPVGELQAALQVYKNASGRRRSGAALGLHSPRFSVRLVARGAAKCGRVVVRSASIQKCARHFGLSGSIARLIFAILLSACIRWSAGNRLVRDEHHAAPRGRDEASFRRHVRRLSMSVVVAACSRAGDL